MADQKLQKNVAGFVLIHGDGRTFFSSKHFHKPQSQKKVTPEEIVAVAQYDWEFCELFRDGHKLFFKVNPAIAGSYNPVCGDAYDVEETGEGHWYMIDESPENKNLLATRIAPPSVECSLPELPLHSQEQWDAYLSAAEGSGHC